MTFGPVDAGLATRLPSTKMMVTLQGHLDGLVQERRNSNALAMELCLSSTKPLILHWYKLFRAEISSYFNAHIILGYIVHPCPNLNGGFS